MTLETLVFRDVPDPMDSQERWESLVLLVLLELLVQLDPQETLGALRRLM